MTLNKKQLDFMKKLKNNWLRLIAFIIVQVFVLSVSLFLINKEISKLPLITDKDILDYIPLSIYVVLGSLVFMLTFKIVDNDNR